MNGFCVRSVPSEGILSSVHPQTQPVLFCVVCPDPQPLNCRLTFDPVLYLMIPQSCQGPEGRSGAWVRITWPTPWGCCHGDCIWHTTHEISCSWLARCLTQWFPLQTNHIGFYWAGWKIPLLFHWDTGLKFCHAVRLNSQWLGNDSFDSTDTPRHFYLTLLHHHKASEGYKGACTMKSICPKETEMTGQMK